MTRTSSKLGPDTGADLVPICALTRRRFVGAAATVTLVGCGPAAMPTKKLGKVESNVLELELAKIPELAVAGGMVAVLPDGLKKPLIVMRLEGERFRVLSSKCTHLGCTVRWDNEEQLLRCPCHGSRFTDDGKVSKGPAKTPLREFPTDLAGTIFWMRSDKPMRVAAFEGLLSPETMAARLDRIIDWLESGAIPKAQCASSLYADLIAHPVEAVRRVYERCELEFNPETEQRVRAYLASKPQGKHGRHEYAVAESEEIRRRRRLFARYQAYFGIPDEAV